MRRNDPFLISQLNTGHPFLLSRAIRGHPFPKAWEWKGIRFNKMGIRFPKHHSCKGIKRMQLPLLKLKKATQQNTHFEIHTSAPSVHGVIDSFRILQRALPGLGGGLAGPGKGRTAAGRGGRTPGRAPRRGAGTTTSARSWLPYPWSTFAHRIRGGSATPQTCDPAH